MTRQSPTKNNYSKVLTFHEGVTINFRIKTLERQHKPKAKTAKSRDRAARCKPAKGETFFYVDAEELTRRRRGMTVAIKRINASEGEGQPAT